MSDAFATVRSLVGDPRPPRLESKKYEDELRQMTPSEGLSTVQEYTVEPFAQPTHVPDVTEELKRQAPLWVVRVENCVHAPEYSEFGATLGNGCIKHTNLTGGKPAFAGGELIWLGEREVLVNGCSGRYGPLSADEMATAAKAFANAGYRVWSTGYDEGSGRCFKFGASVPSEVSAT
jgi:hypothetical protein